MNADTYKTLKHLLHYYKRTGSKAYRKKQVVRLVFMLNNIFEYEKISSNQLNALGRKHIIGFWRRHQNLSEKTRKEYWAITNVLFEQLGKPRPPLPKPSKNEEVVNFL